MKIPVFISDIKIYIKEKSYEDFIQISGFIALDILSLYLCQPRKEVHKHLRGNIGASVPLHADFPTERMSLHGTDAQHGHALVVLRREKSMKHLIQIALMGVVVLAVASMAAAEAGPPEA